MIGEFELIDCNRYAVEPADLWDRLEPPFRGAVRRGGSPLSLAVEGEPVFVGVPDWVHDPEYAAAFKDALSRGFDTASNLADMDRQGVDVALLLPATSPYAAFAERTSAELQVAICRAYNDWLGQYLQAGSGRLKGVALLPLSDPDAAATELRRTIAELGFVAALLVPKALTRQRCHDRAYDPLFEAAAGAGAPLLVADIPGLSRPEIGTDRFQSFYGRKAVGEAFEAWFALASFMGHDVVERFPGLKVGFAGAGCGWLACWIDRLDEHWGNHFGADAPSYLPPDHLFRTQGFAVCDPWEKTLAAVIEETGEDTLMWGSRYPMPEAAVRFPDGAAEVLANERLSEAQKRKILADNARAVFHL